MSFLAWPGSRLGIATPRANEGSQMADVVEINDLEELESYRLAWTALLPQTPRASFFHTFDWFRHYWTHFGQGKRMRVLVVRAAGAPIGVVPLCVSRERYHVGTVRVLNYPLQDWGSWYGPIGGNASATMFMALRHLRNTRRDWDMIDLRWTSGDRPEQNATKRSMHAVGWRPQKQPYQQLSVLRFGNMALDDYVRSLSKKWRHEIRRQRRGIERVGSLSIERYRPAGQLAGEDDARWDLFDDCLHISEQSWQGSSTTGNTMSHSHVTNFLRDCHASSVRLGMLDVAVLKIDHQPAAYQYNYHYDGNLYGLRMGFAPDFSRLGVGKVLMSHVVEDSFRRGDVSLDMGIGDFKFKRQFRTHVETNYRVASYPWTAWRSQAVRVTQWLKRRLVAEVPSKGQANSA